MDPARRASARVQREAVSSAVPLEEAIEVPMAGEYTAPQHRMELPGGLADLVKMMFRGPLRPELRDQPVVVDLPLHVPRRDDEVLGHRSAYPGYPDKDCPWPG